MGLQVGPEEVAKLLKDLSPNKASGPDAIPNRILIVQGSYSFVLNIFKTVSRLKKISKLEIMPFPDYILQLVSLYLLV